VKQAYINSTGQLIAGAGGIVLNSSGLEIRSAGEANIWAKWFNSDITTPYTGAYGFANLQLTDPLSHTWGVFNVGIRHDANHQSGMSSFVGEVNCIMQVEGTWHTPLKITPMVTTVTGSLIVSMRLALTDGVAAPTAEAGLAKIYVDSADGDLKVMFGDGVTKVLATDT